MNIMFNNQPFISGGNLKITDFLEDPVEITEYTAEQLNKLDHQYILFGDFYYNNNYYNAFHYTGYIPFNIDTNPAESDYIFVTSNIKSIAANKNTFYIYYYGHNIDNTPHYTKLITVTSTNKDPITYPNKFKGKIWIGKYKQQVQE